MPHTRVRYARAIIEKGISLSPLVGVVGHRQVGKTTLLEQIAKTYITFDDRVALKLAEMDPPDYLSAFTSLRVGIDECQLLPALFPALKERVRKDKRPGQFVLSGSVRFTSKKAIQESLTGRILNFELLPMTIGELTHQPLCETTRRLIGSTNLVRTIEQLEPQVKPRRKLWAEMRNYFERGGLPGVCFIREANLRHNKIDEQLKTILDRDLRQVYPSSLSMIQIREFLNELADAQGFPINHMKLRAKTGLSPITQKKLLYALESLFIIRILPTGGTARKYICYFEDQAEAAFFRQTRDLQLEFEELIYRHIRTEFMYSMGLPFRISQYTTRNGVRVPICIQSQESVLGLIPIHQEEPERVHLAAAQSFLRSHERSRAIIVTTSDKIQDLGPRVFGVPATLFL